MNEQSEALPLSAEPPYPSVAQRARGQVRVVKDLFRLKPFDTATQQGRSMERFRRAALTTFTSLGLRALSVFTSLITVPLTLRYLGTERYGLWMTISSVVSMMAFADLGIGNGLLTSVSEAHGRDDREAARKYVSSASIVLSGVAIAILGLLGLAYPFVPWPRVFNVSSSLAAREAGPAVAVLVICFALNLPLDVVQRVQRGYQEGFESNLWGAGGNVMALTFLLVAMQFRGGLPSLALAMSGGLLLGVLANWGHQFGRTRPWLFPRSSHWDRAAARKVLGTGAMFFILQACGLFSVPVDNVVIARILGPEAVAQYAVPMRLFLLLLSTATMFVMPLWPAYGEALARGDVKWVKSTLYRSTGYTLLGFGSVAVGLAGFGKIIMRVWVGNQIRPTYPLLFGMATWTVLAVFGIATSTFFAGINKLRFQVVVSVVAAVGMLVSKIGLTRVFGLPGAAWAPVVTAVPTTVLFAAYINRLLAHPESLATRQAVADDHTSSEL